MNSLRKWFALLALLLGLMLASPRVQAQGEKPADDGSSAASASASKAEVEQLRKEMSALKAQISKPRPRRRKRPL